MSTSQTEDMRQHFDPDGSPARVSTPDSGAHCAVAPCSALYRITAEIVAADRDAALSILLKLVNDGYTSLRERGDLPISWSQGGVSGNGEFHAGLLSESVSELDKQLALASEYMADCAKLERKADILARHAREAFFRAEARRKAAQPLPNNGRGQTREEAPAVLQPNHPK